MGAAANPPQSNPHAQISWMIGYIRGRYGDPIGAAAHERNFGWYDRGGFLPPGLSLAYNGTGYPEQVIPGGRGRQPVPIVLELRSSGTPVDEMLLQILRRSIRVRGGNAQIVLGSRS
jgi:hypothetical protein